MRHPLSTSGPAVVAVQGGCQAAGAVTARLPARQGRVAPLRGRAGGAVLDPRVPAGPGQGGTAGRARPCPPPRARRPWRPAAGVTVGGSGGSVVAGAVGDVDGLVVAGAAAQAVPEDLEPAVAEGAQRGVVGLAGGPLGVVEVAGPAAAGQAAKRPLVHRVAEVAVVRQATGDDDVALAGATGHRGTARVALQRVRRGELLEVVADFAGDPGGETITQARHAQVDLAARDHLPRVGVLPAALAAGAGGADQQLTMNRTGNARGCG